MEKNMTRRSFLKIFGLLITGFILYPLKSLFTLTKEKPLHPLKEAKHWRASKRLAG